MRVSNNPPNRLIIPNYAEYSDMINFYRNTNMYLHVYRHKYRIKKDAVSWWTMHNFALYIVIPGA